MQKLNTVEFIRRSKEHHGDFYDYSQSVYTTYRAPVIVICPTHGEFMPQPSNHMRGSGCTACGHDKIRIQLSAFVDRANTAHENKYTYTKTTLMSNMNAKVVITCPDHGDFEQRAASHVDGIGCPSCVGLKPITQNEFIDKSNNIHNDKYDYNLVTYLDRYTKVDIVCPIHGKFSQVPSDHMGGCGCQLCGGTSPLTKMAFIANAREYHGDKYDYSLVDIQGANTKVDIVCPIHGAFTQRPADHQRGVGCPTCGTLEQSKSNNHQYNSSDVGLLYLVTVGEHWCKVGVTKQKTASARFRSSNVSVVCEHRMMLSSAYDIEQTILGEFLTHRMQAPELRKERFAGWTECFPITLLPEIKQYMQELLK